MATYTADGPIYNSYVEAYLAASKAHIPADAGSRTSTAHYGYGPSGSAQRLKKSKNFVDGNPMPAKTISVLHRPAKPSSAKNAENLDVQHERDKAAFQRRANIYRRHAQSHYHHHAPPGSILTTFEQGHIVDRGRRKCYSHESRGVYDPVVHSYRVPPAPEVAAAQEAAEERGERPTSVPSGRALAEQQQPQHTRSTTPFEHKLLQASRGTYNPLTHEYTAEPEPEYAKRREREFLRATGTGPGMRKVPTAPPATDPINWSSPKESPKDSPAESPQPSTASASDADAKDRPAAVVPGRRQRPTSAPSGPVGLRKSMAGPSWGTYNPLTHEWRVPPTNEKFMQQDVLLERQLGMSGCSAGRTITPRQQGVYNPILNTWTVPPANPRVVDGLSFQPATLFSRPTPATIRM